jgi:hypothetical protein
MRCKIQALALIALEMALSPDFISNSSFALPKPTGLSFNKV